MKSWCIKGRKISEGIFNLASSSKKPNQIIKHDALLFYSYRYWKKDTFQFCFSGLLGIHRNPKWKEFLKYHESFLRKSSVCTLTDLNPGFGGLWNMLWIFFGYGTFIMLQKESFGPPKNWISCTGWKVPLWQFFNSAKWHFSTRAWNSKKFWPKDFFWSTYYESALSKKYS